MKCYVSVRFPGNHEKWKLISGHSIVFVQSASSFRYGESHGPILGLELRGKSFSSLWFSALQKLVRGAARGGQLCLKRSLFQYNDVVGDEALECNGYLDLKAPPSPYVQRQDSTQDKAPVHPSIAGFPRKVLKNEWKFFVKLIHLFFRKAYRSVTFKGSQTVQIPKCCSSLGIAIEGSNIDLISCKPEKAL